ncbi:LD-carboxypeptidase [Micromonospora sp. M51]|uniref:LD-carboxypeptidase n=1 Tax=Micromonospora sp. M51 TaxID=2824889 RepID=UPI001B387AED|nr:LD-carboxypeptidase [Micromonospora sp. M51]MBQ1009897.1 LD-carboxypeptidase [Micromonospora sp. M51]
MVHELVRPRKARPGDHLAVLSPSFAAAGAYPAILEQARRRLADLTGLVPVEYPTTRQVGASAAARAADINAAFADPQVRGILAVVGGDDQITVIPHLDADLARADPKPFLGTSDNTNLHHWLWGLGIASFYGGSSQVHLGPGPAVDDVHVRSLRAALLTGERLEVTDPGESEDIGIDWADPQALKSFGEREPTQPWSWYGPSRSVTGRTWGGCLEVIQWILTAGRFPFPPEALQGGVLLIETSEELLPAREVGWIVRSLGERGLLSAVDAVVVARPPVSDHNRRPAAEDRARLREQQRDTVVDVVTRYNPEAVVCGGVPFGHTRPQWILPHGGPVTVDGVQRRIFADYR